MNLDNDLQTLAQFASLKSLTPAQRALLRAVKQAFMGAIGSTLIGLITALMAGQQLTTALLISAALTVFYTVAGGVSKYLSANGDPDLANLIDLGKEALQKRTEQYSTPVFSNVYVPGPEAAQPEQTAQIETK